MPQSLSQLWVHIIFSTKDRYPFFKNSDIRKKVHHYIKAICYKQNCIPLIVGGVEDHVHILINLDKKSSLSKVVEEIKKSTSKWIKTLRMFDHDLTKFYWQRGYGSFSVSQSNLETVRFYIENQHKHHQKLSFQEELRKFFIQHGVAYEEKYLWD
jgi:putative transposase